MTGIRHAVRCHRFSSVWGTIVTLLLLISAGTILLRSRDELKRHAACGLSLLALLAGGGIASGQTADFAAPHHPERLLVRFKAGTPEPARQAVHGAVGAVELKRYRYFDGLVLAKVSANRLQQACAQYLSNPNVLYAEPDYEIEFDGPCDACDPIDPNGPDVPTSPSVGPCTT